MLFSKQIDQLTYDDVVRFCQLGLPEGLHLDYKVALPQKLFKHIAAMANTLGGIIILGVDEQGDKPALPFVGMPYDPKIRNTIEQIIRCNINSPPFVEIANCHDPSQSNAFVVIRVPQSISTPHSLTSDGSVYVRTGQSSNPERIASPDEIGWLYERRRKSTELKSNLKARSVSRFRNLLAAKKFRPDIENAILSLSISPSYPTEILFDYKRSEDKLKQLIKSQGLPAGENEIQVASGSAISTFAQVDAELMQAGVPIGGKFTYIEIEEHGLFVFYNQASEVDTRKLPFLPLSHAVVPFLTAAAEFYKGIGFWGYLDFSCEISQAAGMEADLYRCDPKWRLSTSTVLDDSILIESRFASLELIHALDNIAFDLLGKLSHGIGVKGTSDQFFNSVMGGISNYMTLIRSPYASSRVKP
jgi:hypothetical protein